MVLNSLLLMRKEINFAEEGLTLIIIVLSVICTMIAIFMVMKQNLKGIQFLKKNAVAMMLVNVLMILVIALTASLFYSYKSGEKNGTYKFTSLTEIKDSITVENDKVKIDKLAKDYKYVSDYMELRSDETQIFKLEENKFYEKRWLVDQYGRRFQLDNEEYKMLIDKRQK